MHVSLRLAFGILLIAMSPYLLAAQDSLPDQARQVFKDRCYRCHGGNATAAGLDVLSHESLLGVRGNEQLSTQWVVPGDSDASMLWQAVDSGYMPMDDSDEANAMSDEEREVLREWITAGAEFPQRTAKVRMDQTAVYSAIRDFLMERPLEDRKFYRFFSLAHLNNNPNVSEQELRYHRAALAKALNSLIFRKRVFADLEPVGVEKMERGTPQDGVVFALDLRDMDWDQNQNWQFILDHYPYGVQYEFSENRELRELYKEVRTQTGTTQPVIRADWFVVYGTQHPLYTKLLELPPHLDGIQDRLGVNFVENIEKGRVDRAGFAKSGVSRQNRLVERHEGSSGYVWISYDFFPRRARGDLVRFPLGPEYEGNPFNKVAFEHDGGELIFRLPNGMQGYMLVLGDGSRLDDPAPSEVVFDTSGVTGSTAILNGISCMNCHARGMIAGFQDDVRDARAVGGDAQLFVEKIYSPPERMDEVLEMDRDSYLDAERRITGPYLEEGDIGEPVGKVAQRYFTNIDSETAAQELGMKDGETLRAIISTNSELTRLGLGRYAQENPSTIQRVIWESTNGLSYWQEIMSQVHPGALPIGPSALGR